MSARGHWTVVREVISSTTTGVDVMSALPGLVERLLDEEAWREFDAPPPIGHVEYTSFRKFVEAKPAGLGSRLDQLKALCGDRKDLAERVQQQYDEEIEPLASHGGNRRSKEFQADQINLKPQGGTSRSYVIARLERDDPELAKQVKRGELSAAAAARRKGWRKPSILISTPERTAESLRKHMPAEARQALARLLLEED